MEFAASPAAATLDSRRPDYQALKTRIHEELLAVECDVGGK